MSKAWPKLQQLSAQLTNDALLDDGAVFSSEQPTSYVSDFNVAGYFTGPAHMRTDAAKVYRNEEGALYVKTTKPMNVGDIVDVPCGWVTLCDEVYVTDAKRNLKIPLPDQLVVAGSVYEGRYYLDTCQQLVGSILIGDNVEECRKNLALWVMYPNTTKTPNCAYEYAWCEMNWGTRIKVPVLKMICAVPTNTILHVRMIGPEKHGKLDRELLMRDVLRIERHRCRALIKLNNQNREKMNGLNAVGAELATLKTAHAGVVAEMATLKRVHTEMVTEFQAKRQRVALLTASMQKELEVA